MSRIGRMPVVVPSGVDVTIDGAQVTVKGPKGTLSHTVAAPITVERNDDGVLEVKDLEGVVGKTLEIQLKYGRSRERSIAGVRRISKPGLRVYAKHTALPKVLGGLGVAIISTSQGLLTDRQANSKGVGGEVLAYVW